MLAISTMLLYSFNIMSFERLEDTNQLGQFRTGVRNLARKVLPFITRLAAPEKPPTDPYSELGRAFIASSETVRDGHVTSLNLVELNGFSGELTDRFLDAAKHPDLPGMAAILENLRQRIKSGDTVIAAIPEVGVVQITPWQLEDIRSPGPEGQPAVL